MSCIWHAPYFPSHMYYTNIFTSLGSTGTVQRLFPWMGFDRLRCLRKLFSTLISFGGCQTGLEQIEVKNCKLKLSLESYKCLEICSTAH